MEDALLHLHELKKSYSVSRGFLSGKAGVVRAVDNVSLTLFRGETLGLVGESGCGKSTLGRLILKLEEPTGGVIRYAGADVRTLSGKALKAYRREVQIVFQDPYASLNPRKTAGDAVGEPLVIHRLVERNGQEKRIAELLEMVGLSGDHRNRYPHEFSGGQRQRIGIARALALRPKLIVADEPVSALDVSIQAQILNLLKDLQRDFDLTYLFITHDLGVVRFMSDRIAVMYRGKIVEIGTNEDVYRRSAHPYTKALLRAIPSRMRQKRPLMEVGEEANLRGRLSAGCVFRPRCPAGMKICGESEPPLAPCGPDHFRACHLPLPPES